MKRTAILVALQLSLLPVVGFATEFTEAQLREIRQMMADMKAELRNEVRREVLEEMAARGELANNAAASPTTGEQAPAPDASVAETADPPVVDSLEQSSEAVIVVGQSLLKQTNVGVHDREGGDAEKGVQITAGTEGGRASLKYGYVVSKPGDAGHKSSFRTTNFVLSGPLDKREGQPTQLATLDGLANDLEISFRQSWLRTETPKEITFRKLIADCKLLGVEKCDDAALLQAIVDQKRQGEPAFSYLFPKSSSWVYGYGLKLGYDEFAHFSPADLTKRIDRETSWAASAFFGRLTGKRYYAVGFEFQDDHEAARAETACRNAGNPILRCVSGALAPPSDRNKNLLTAEYRRWVTDFAFGVRLTHDLKKDETGVDVPIYLFPDDKGLLTGGLRLGWTTEDDFSAGIFVGTAFKQGPDRN